MATRFTDKPPKRPDRIAELVEWADKVTEYIQALSQEVLSASPQALFLEHQNSGQIYKAIEDGLLMYDPATNQPVYTKAGKWEPMGADLRMRWMGGWAGEGTAYEQGDVVYYNGYLMVANKDTTDNPTPTAIGLPTYVYKGTSPTGAILAKQLDVYNTYTLAVDLSLTGYRVYTITGNFYSVYVIDSDSVISEIAAFEAISTGWREFEAPGRILLSGQQFTVGVRVAEPDPTPTTFTGNWNYEVPGQSVVPGSGEISHGRNSAGIFNIHKTDNDGGDRSADLSGLEVGDVIDDGIIRWSIQAIVDNGTYYEFTVAPAAVSAAGLKQFTFETVTATPITTVIDPDYYLTSQSVRPSFSIDNAPATETDDGYGVDVEYQEIAISPDWDFMAYSDSIGL